MGIAIYAGPTAGSDRFEWGPLTAGEIEALCAALSLFVATEPRGTGRHHVATDLLADARAALRAAGC